MSQTGRGSLERLRARFAFDEVSQWPGPIRDRAHAEVKGLPVALRTQGLVQTLATLVNGEPHQTRLAQAIARWVLEEAPRRPLERWLDSKLARPEARLLAACVRAERTAYLAGQSEALAIVEKLKIFAEAQAALEGGAQGAREPGHDQ
jgi:hypothetical protein